MSLKRMKVNHNIKNKMFSMRVSSMRKRERVCVLEIIRRVFYCYILLIRTRRDLNDNYCTTLFRRL